MIRSTILCVGILVLLAAAAPAAALPGGRRGLRELPSVMPKMDMPPLKEFLPPMEDISLPSMNEFMGKVGLQNWNQTGLPPMEQLMKAYNSTNGTKLPPLKDIMKQADGLMTSVVFELLPPQLREAYKKSREHKATSPFASLPKLNLTDLASKIEGFTPEAVENFNLTEAIVNFNLTETADKLNITLPESLKDFKLPPPTPEVQGQFKKVAKGIKPAVEAIIKMGREGEGAFGSLKKLKPALAAVPVDLTNAKLPTVSELLKGLDAAAQVAASLPLPKDGKPPSLEELAGALNAAATKVKAASVGPAALIGPQLPAGRRG